MELTHKYTVIFNGYQCAELNNHQFCLSIEEGERFLAVLRPRSTKLGAASVTKSKPLEGINVRVSRINSRHFLYPLAWFSKKII